VKLVARLIATGLFTGYAPVASGTFGTLPGVVLAVALGALELGTAARIAAIVSVVVVCIWAADVHAREIGLKDPGVVVCDEIAGFVVTMALLPMTVATLLGAFLLFRLFDIVKPPPVRQAEALPGGLGIVADDVLAGLLANLVLRGLLAWKPELAALAG
jgi:phosphatidylglycerophosphatase A